MRLARAGVAALGLLAACEAQHKGAVEQYGKLICRTASDSTVIAVAVRAYVNDVNPAPRRFLYLPGNDSTPPEAAVAVLQDVGPTYVYSMDPKLQTPLRKLLVTAGDYPTLLLEYHGLQRADPMHPIVTLSGHYVTGSFDGNDASRRTIALACDSTGWRAPSTSRSSLADPSATPAPPASPSASGR